MPNNHESATVSFPKKIRQLNKALGALIDFAGAMTLEVQLQVILREKEEGKMHTLVGSVAVNSVMPQADLLKH